MPICLVTVLIGANRKTQDSEHFKSLISNSSLSACSLAEESTLALGRLLCWDTGSYYLRTSTMHLSRKFTDIFTVVTFRVQICGAGLRHGYYRGETIYERWVNMTTYLFKTAGISKSPIYTLQFSLNLSWKMRFTSFLNRGSRYVIILWVKSNLHPSIFTKVQISTSNFKTG